MDIKLNPGGVIGALVFMGGVLWAFYSPRGEIRTRHYLTFGVAAFAGSAAGNFLWSLIFPPKPKAR